MLVVIDGGRVGDGGQLADANGLQGVTVLDLSGALPAGSSTRNLRLRVSSDAVLRVGIDRLGKEILTPVAVPDAIGPAEAAATSRAIAAKVMPDEANGDEPLVTATGLTDLLGVTNVSTLDPRTAWRTRQPRDRFRVAIGVGATGQAVELDLKEAARGGMGPHGLVVGATGSGKSELLRTLVLGLAMTHPPESLNFVLVDFKGGATFTRLDALPHTSAVITNLSDELTMVDRMRDAISGEMHRRMELLRGAGHFASLQDYETARTTTGLIGGAGPLPEIPTLLIVVDEFSELLSAKPDFLDLFITIGRVGRSLGVHLLLASQRLEEGRLRGLDTYLSYRIGLKTFSGAESRIVLGVPDAFELPTAPGNGYLKFDTGSLLRFKAAYVSGPVRGQAPSGDGRRWLDAEPFRLTLPTGPASSPATAAADSVPMDGSGLRAPAGGAGRVPAPTLLDIAVSRLAGSGTPAHRGVDSAAARATVPGSPAGSTRSRPASLSMRAGRHAGRSGPSRYLGNQRLRRRHRGEPPPVTPRRTPPATARGRTPASACRSAGWTGLSSSAAAYSPSICPGPAVTSRSSARRKPESPRRCGV